MVRIRKRGSLERECAIPEADLGTCPGGASNLHRLDSCIPRPLPCQWPGSARFRVAELRGKKSKLHKLGTDPYTDCRTDLLHNPDCRLSIGEPTLSDLSGVLDSGAGEFYRGAGVRDTIGLHFMNIVDCQTDPNGAPLRHGAGRA